MRLLSSVASARLPRAMSLLTLLWTLLGVGCGQKGPLSLPAPPQANAASSPAVAK